MSIQPEEPGTTPVVETIEGCDEHNLDMLLVHATDGTHLGFAFNVLRARSEGEDEFAAQITDLVGEDEMLRSAVELIAATVAGLVVTDCGDPECESHDLPDDADEGCADPLACYGYLIAMSDTLHATPGQGDLALLCEDVAEFFTVEDTEVFLHYVDVERALALAERLVEVVEKRHGVGLEEQAAEYQKMLAAGV